MSGFAPNIPLENQLRYETFDEFKNRYGFERKYLDELKLKRLSKDYSKNKRLIKI